MSTPADDPALRWTDDRAQRWLAQADALDRQMAPITELLFEGAALQAGERVLDVGCGSGPTTRRAAQAVGPGGGVIGLDISRAMLDSAAAHEVEAGAAPIEWLEVDAARWEPAIDPVDAVISRFGVMFFEDPVGAFHALRSAARPGGRLCAVTWDRRDRSAIFQVPFTVVTRLLQDLGHAPEPLAVDGGAFSLHDPDVVTATLIAAGWENVSVEAHVVRLPVGGGLDPEGAADAVLWIGPSRLLTEHLDPGELGQVRDALAATLADHVDGDGHVVLPGSVVRITARR
ncbi:MAG: class I SAM-dependent methyltransferase [Actinomycetota bacterium]